MDGLIGLVIDNIRVHEPYYRRIAELNAAMELRAAAEARLTTVLDSSDAILGVNQQGCMTLFNKGAEVIVFRYPWNEMLVAPIERFSHKRFVARHANHMDPR